MLWPKVKIKSGCANDSHTLPPPCRRVPENKALPSPLWGPPVLECPRRGWGLEKQPARAACTLTSTEFITSTCQSIPTQVATKYSNVVCNIIFKCKYLNSWRASRRVWIYTRYVRGWRWVGKGKRTRKGVIVSSLSFLFCQADNKNTMLLCHFKLTVWTNKCKPNDSLVFMYFEVRKYKVYTSLTLLFLFGALNLLLFLKYISLYASCLKISFDISIAASVFSRLALACFIFFLPFYCWPFCIHIPKVSVLKAACRWILLFFQHEKLCLIKSIHVKCKYWYI